jgi:transposase InsO family protein
MADHLRTEVALGARRPGAGLIHHTDRGCQDTAAANRQVLAARGVVASMSRRGDCYDNAMAERFFATLKVEIADAGTWPTRAAARTAIFAWLEVGYNRQRRHSALAYRTPVAHEEQHLLLLQDLAA